MNIYEIEFIYYGEKCKYLEILEEKISEKSEDKESSCIVLTKELLNAEEVIESNAEITPVIKINGVTLKRSGTVLCNECTQKYGVSIFHSEYDGIEENKECNKIEQRTIETVIEFKANKTSCCGSVECNCNCKNTGCKG